MRLASFFLLLTLLATPCLSTHAAQIISDIDDTVKLTGANSKTGKPDYWYFLSLEPFAGMSTLYQRWGFRNSPRQTVGLHFLSGSFTMLQNRLEHFFIINNFPSHSLTLKTDPFEPTENYKVAAITTMIQALDPNEKLLLIGDDTEADFKAYATLANQFPNRVLATYIHRIVGQTAMPANQMLYSSAMEIALNEFQYKRLTENDVMDVAQSMLMAVNAQNHYPRYMICKPQHLNCALLETFQAEQICQDVDQLLNKFCPIQ